MKKAVNAYKAWTRDPRTFYALQQNRSLPVSRANDWRKRTTERAPLITLGGIVEVCQQGATVHVYEDKLVVSLGSFIGVVKLGRDTDYDNLVIDTLYPWILST